MQKQLVQVHRLGQIIIRPRLEASALVLDGIPGRHQHNGQQGIAAPQLTGQLPAVHHGHHHIGDDQVGHHPLDGMEGFLPVGGRDGLVPVQPQKRAHHPLQGKIVLHDQNRKHAWHPLLLWQWLALPVLYHMLRRASMGFSREALRAGAQPKRIPTEAEKVNASTMAPVDILKVNPMTTAIM